jgi:hypothetical protein
MKTATPPTLPIRNLRAAMELKWLSLGEVAQAGPMPGAQRLSVSLHPADVVGACELFSKSALEPLSHNPQPAS